MRHWVKTQNRVNQDIDPDLFTREIAVAEAIKMVTIADETLETDAELKLPYKFELIMKWTVLSEAFDTYLNRLKGHG